LLGSRFSLLGLPKNRATPFFFFPSRVVADRALPFFFPKKTSRLFEEMGGWANSAVRFFSRPNISIFLSSFFFFCLFPAEMVSRRPHIPPPLAQFCHDLFPSFFWRSAKKAFRVPEHLFLLSPSKPGEGRAKPLLPGTIFPLLSTRAKIHDPFSPSGTMPMVDELRESPLPFSPCKKPHQSDQTISVCLPPSRRPRRRRSSSLLLGLWTASPIKLVPPPPFFSLTKW